MTKSKEVAQKHDEAQAAQATVLRPSVDVFEDDASITLHADLPGVPKDGLQVAVEGDTLTISGAVALHTPGDMEPMHAELRSPTYRRSFTLSDELDGDKISARLADGVLTLEIPKHEAVRPRKIEVQVS